jgi:hypothetical protein
MGQVDEPSHSDAAAPRSLVASSASKLVRKVTTTARLPKPYPSIVGMRLLSRYPIVSHAATIG